MKASERRLLSILGVLTAVCGGAILSQRLLLRQHAIERREQTLELKRMEHQAMMAEADLWKQRLDWLQEKQPSMSSVNQASEDLLEKLLAAASAQGLTIQKKQLHEPVTAVYYREIGVTLTVKGSLSSVFRWMHGLLTPESFRVVSQLRITPDAANPAEVIAVMHVSQLHSPDIANETSTEKKGGA